MPVRTQTLSAMNGSTRCPHCETRFKISDAQFAAHRGMVRCGHCMQAFDARPGFIPENDLEQLALQVTEEHPAHLADEPIHPIEEKAPEQIEEYAPEADAAPDAPQDELTAETNHIEAEDFGPELTVELPEADYEPAEVHIERAAMHIEQPEIHIEQPAGRIEQAAIPVEQPAADTLDFSHLADRLPETAAATAPEPEISTPPVKPLLEKPVFEPATVAPARRWPWIAGITMTVLLLLAQSAYFFRVGLSVRLPALKPALVSYCQLLGCTVPLPQTAELLSIESSGLEAEPGHENAITLTALLRNRANYSMAFPMLTLTLNDIQDKPLARRLFTPAEYLPADENVQTGFMNNHEISIRLRLNTADLKASGYRLELYYP